MVRTLIGGLVGGLVIFILGYLFWATPLSDIAYSRADDAKQAAVHTALASNLSEKKPETGEIGGTGTYRIPDPGSQQGANLYTNGPVATVHYNTGGFSPTSTSSIVPRAILAAVTGLLMAFGLAAAAGEGRSYGSMARVVVGFSLAFTVWEFLGSPIFNHYGWGYWIYAFVAESVSFLAAGLVIARWFLPHGGRVGEDHASPEAEPHAGV